MAALLLCLRKRSFILCALHARTKNQEGSHGNMIYFVAVNFKTEKKEYCCG